MQYKKMSKKDFDWIHWTPADITKKGDEIITLNEKVIQQIITLSEKRTFNNSFLPLDKLHALTEDF